MEKISTQDLLLLHAYGETTNEQQEFLAREMAANPALHEELMEIISTKAGLNSAMKSPSETSVRIVMEHSFKTEHLQETE